MKKLPAVLLLCASILLTGCGGSGSGKSNTIAEPFAYPQHYENGIWAIASEGDTLYVLSSADQPYTSEVSTFDLDGNQINSILLDYDFFNIKAVCAADGVLYAAVNDSGPIILCSADMERGEVKTLFEFENADDITKIGMYGGKLYWLGQSYYDVQYVEPIYTKEGEMVVYSDNGLRIGCLDIVSCEDSLSKFDHPVSFSVSASGVKVYAFDSEVGYYFADYSAPDEKIYTNKLNGMGVNDFDFFGEEGAFVFNNYGGKKLAASKADDKSGIAEIADQTFTPNHICTSESGFVWAVVSDVSADVTDMQVKRFDLSGFTVEGDPVRIITSQYYGSDPFSAGVEISSERLSSESFALRVLSLDKNYDIARVSSDSSFANDIKEKGSFYPLNDVKGVEEYLDMCFPYIKEAVTDDEGNICMLPISVEIPIIAYNEKNCAENNIVFSSDLEEFISSIERASTVNDYYMLLRYNMVKLQLMGYTSCNDTFDTDEFRSMAALLKERCTDDVFQFCEADLYYQINMAQYGEESSIYSQIQFIQLLYLSEQIGMIGDSNYRAAAVPSPKSGKNIAVCAFLCVNPYSDRLSETLTYIENVTKYMSTVRNSYMIADKNTYDDTVFEHDMYDIYENGDIYFQMPTEVYLEDFDRYCADEITLEELISEADRKLAVYLNE